MATIISPRRRVEATEYSLSFDSVATPGWGYGFPCDAEGNVLAKALIERGSIWTPASIEAFRKSLIHEGQAFHPPVVRRFDNSYMQPAVMRCHCGAELELCDPMDNVCDHCGRIFNSGGQQVRCLARDVDYLDAGEVYDDD